MPKTVQSTLHHECSRLYCSMSTLYCSICSFIQAVLCVVHLQFLLLLLLQLKYFLAIVLPFFVCLLGLLTIFLWLVVGFILLFFFLYSPHTLSICDISRAFVEWFSVHTFVTQQVVERLMPRQILQNKWKSREVRKFCGNEVKKNEKKYCFKRKIKNVWAQPCEFYDGFASNERNIDIRCTSLIRLWNIFRYIFCSPHKLYIIHIVNMCDCRLHCLKAQFIIRLQCPPAKHFHRQHVWSGFHSLNYLLLWPFETAQVTLPLHIHESSVNVMNDIALLVSLLMILMLFCFLLSHKFFSSFCYI